MFPENQQVSQPIANFFPQAACFFAMAGGLRTPYFVGNPNVPRISNKNAKKLLG